MSAENFLSQSVANIVKEWLQEYLHKIDPVGNLNLNNLESVVGYRLGSTCRNKLEPTPDGLPAKCVAETANYRTSHTLQLVLRGEASFGGYDGSVILRIIRCFSPVVDREKIR